MICAYPAYALHEARAQYDSLNSEISYEYYIALVFSEHPIAKQADLRQDRAKYVEMAARGLFDPNLEANWSDKNYAAKNYYQYIEAGVRVPLPVGADVIANYERTDGVFLNPENQTDPEGLLALGLEVNLLQGLIIDHRRAAKQQAEIYYELADAERSLLLTDLYLEASVAFFEWQRQFYTKAILDSAVVIAENYFEDTKTSFQNGEKSAIDTLEAFLAYQNQQSKSLKAEADLIYQKFWMESFIWRESQAVRFPSSVFPQEVSSGIERNIENLDMLIQRTMDLNPELLEKRTKMGMLQIEERLKRDKYKPKLKLKYQPLISGNINEVESVYSLNDYKWGLDFSFPLFLRSERAEVQQNMIKQQEIFLDLENKENEIVQKLEALYLQQFTLSDAIELQVQKIAGYQRLYDTELIKLNLGESSFFILNKRLEKRVESQMKLYELRQKLSTIRVKIKAFTQDI